MASPDANKIATSLDKVAHAIRRSSALYVAMSITPEDSTEADLFAAADRCAEWIRGQADQEEPRAPRPWET